MTAEQKAHISESGIPQLRPLCDYVIHNDGDDLEMLVSEVEFVADVPQLVRGMAI
jgi:hypothetical protein